MRLLRLWIVTGMTEMNDLDMGRKNYIYIHRVFNRIQVTPKFSTDLKRGKEAEQETEKQ
jgi:hypothetical protein